MGFNDYVTLLGTDLPENVTARSFIYGREIDDTSTAHGTKCAEVIHDVAPGAELVFAAYETDVEQLQAVEWLLTQDVDIISNSTGSIYGPMDGSGDIARMANDVVEGGVFWVNSAGNSGDTHYRGVFTDTDGNGFHEFTPDDEMMGFIPNGFVVMVLNWDDWGIGLQDFDLAILDQDQNILATSENIQDGPEDDPAELLTYAFDDNEVYFIAFYASNITRPVTFDFFVYDAEIEYITSEYSITTPADAENTVAVGATFWEDDAVEYYSSRGPTVDGRLKPDISAPAGVSVVVSDQPFFGTSASTPHVAGAAALVLEAYPDMQPHEVRAFLQSRAIDLGPSGPDNDYGYGRLWLGEAPVLEALEPTPTNETPPTATEVPEAVPVVEITEIPTPVQNPIETPTPSEGGIGSIGVTELLLLCACVAVPIILGLGGVVLLVGIWMYRRSRSPQPAPPKRQVPGAALAQAERAAADAPPVAGVDLCPRCKKPHNPGARFCSNCGYELASPSRSKSRPGSATNVEQPCAQGQNSAQIVVIKIEIGYAEADLAFPTEPRLPDLFHGNGTVVNDRHLYPLSHSKLPHAAAGAGLLARFDPGGNFGGFFCVVKSNSPAARTPECIVFNFIRAGSLAIQCTLDHIGSLEWGCGGDCPDLQFGGFHCYPRLAPVPRNTRGL